MKCRKWKQIQNHLDQGEGLALFADHLERCSSCSSRLEFYLRLKALYAAEVSGVLSFQGKGKNLPPVEGEKHIRRHTARLLAAAAVLGCALVFPAMLLHSYLNDRAIQREFAREFAEQLIRGNAAEAALTYDSGYSLTWFDS